MDVQKFNLRLPAQLYAQAAELADYQMLSTNAFIVAAIRNYVTHPMFKQRVAVIRMPPPSCVPAVEVPKVGANQPCPCGSAKSYKYCHGKEKKS